MGPVERSLMKLSGSLIDGVLVSFRRSSALSRERFANAILFLVARENYILLLGTIRCCLGCVKGKLLSMVFGMSSPLYLPCMVSLPYISDNSFLSVTTFSLTSFFGKSIFSLFDTYG